MAIKTPKCPRCGEPPRYRIAIHVVSMGVRDNNGELEETGESYVGKCMGGTVTKYTCGGGHTWEPTIVDGAIKRS